MRVENWLGQICAAAFCVAVCVLVAKTLGGAWTGIAIIACICGFVSIVEFMPNAARIRARARRREP